MVGKQALQTGLLEADSTQVTKSRIVHQALKSGFVRIIVRDRYVTYTSWGLGGLKGFLISKLPRVNAITNY